MKKLLLVASLAAVSVAAHSKVLLQSGLDTLDETYTQLGASAQLVGRQYEFYQETFMWGAGGKVDGSYAVNDNLVVMGDAQFLVASNDEFANQFGSLGVRAGYRFNNRLNVYKTREWSVRGGGHYLWQQWEQKIANVEVSVPSNATAISAGFNLREMYSNRTYTDVWLDLYLTGVLEDNLGHFDGGWSWNRRVGENFLGIEAGLKAGGVKGLYIGFRYALMP